MSFKPMLNNKFQQKNNVSEVNMFIRILMNKIILSNKMLH